MAAALFGLTLVLLAAAGCGLALLRALHADAHSPAERFVLGSAIGLGLLSYAVLLVGLLGWLRPSVLAALVIIEATIGAMPLLTWARDCVSAAASRSNSQEKRSASSEPPNTEHRTPNTEHRTPNTERLLTVALTCFCLFFLLCTLVGALAPPSGDDWDSLAYHLAAPKIYLAQGRIAFIPYDSHTNFPFTMEMLYTVGLTYGGAVGAKLFHWAMAGLTAIGIAAFCRRLFPSGGGAVAMPAWGPPLAAALFLGIPQVQWQATTAYIDLGTTLYQFLALAAFVFAVSHGAGPRESKSTTGWLIISGLMSGWAIGTKMTALIPFTLLLLTAVIWTASKRARTWASWGGLAAFALSALIVACPWYIKSYLWTHNPVYPFFYSLFPHSVGWTQEAEAAYRHEQAFFGLGKGPLELLMAPWNLSMQGWAFFNVLTRHALPGTQPYFDGLRRGGLSAAFLGLVPLSLYTRRWDRRLTGLILYALALLLPWFVLTQQSRYLLPIVAPLAVVAAAVVANLEVDLARWAAGIFVAVLLLQHGTWGWQNVLQRSLPVASGQISSDEYLRRSFQAYEASKFVNTLPPTSKVALFQETRGFYLDRDYLWANPLQNTLIPYPSIQNGVELTRFMKTRLGVTHVLFNRAGAAGSENDRWYRLLKDAIDRGSLIPLHASHDIEVYAIADP